MQIFIEAINLNIWDAIEVGPYIPTMVVGSKTIEKPREEWSEEEKRLVHVGFPLRLLFVPLFLRTNIFKRNPVCRKAHRIAKCLKIKTDESKYRTQGN